MKPQNKQENPITVRLTPEAKAALPQVIEALNKTVPAGFGPVTQNKAFSILVMQELARLTREQSDSHVPR